MGWNDEMNFDILEGKIINKIKVDEEEQEIIFYTNDGVYRMYHSQDCCEEVSIDDICGLLEDLIDLPILMAEEVHGVDLRGKSGYDESYTWTFYKLATAMGYVTIKWYGSSNGYYSESVSFEKLNFEY